MGGYHEQTSLAWRDDGVYTFDLACMVNRFHGACKSSLVAERLLSSYGPPSLSDCVVSCLCNVYVAAAYDKV